MPAMPGPIPPVDGAGVVQLCEANVTGVLAVGTPAPPAQLGGTDRAPMDDPWPAAGQHRRSTHSAGSADGPRRTDVADQAGSQAPEVGGSG